MIVAESGESDRVPGVKYSFDEERKRDIDEKLLEYRNEPSYVFSVAGNIYRKWLKTETGAEFVLYIRGKESAEKPLTSRNCDPLCYRRSPGGRIDDTLRRARDEYLHYRGLLVLFDLTTNERINVRGTYIFAWQTPIHSSCGIIKKKIYTGIAQKRDELKGIGGKFIAISLKSKINLKIHK